MNTSLIRFGANTSRKASRTSRTALNATAAPRRSPENPTPETNEKEIDRQLLARHTTAP
jgi:hypothetical protein